jgi:hypothetical protein
MASPSFKVKQEAAFSSEPIVMKYCILSFLFMTVELKHLWRHNIQHNALICDNQLKNTKHKVSLSWVSDFLTVMLNVIVLNVVVSQV